MRIRSWRTTERTVSLWVIALVAAVGLMLIGTTTAFPAAASQEPAITIPQSPVPLRQWIDVDGNPLPFYTDAQVKEFLSTASVGETENLPIGVTDPIRVKLEKDGKAVHAIFRYLDTVYDRAPMDDGRMRTNLKDSCHFEPAD